MASPAPEAPRPIPVSPDAGRHAPATGRAEGDPLRNKDTQRGGKARRKKKNGRVEEG